MMSTPALTVGFIQQRVAMAYGLDVRLLKSPRRSRKIARPRQVAMWLTEKLLPDMSYPEIGRAFGDRDHTTVMHGVRRVDEMSDHSAAFFDALISLRDDILTATAPVPDATIPINRQARDVSKAFAKAAYALAEIDPQRAARIFRNLHDALKTHGATR